MSWVERSLDQLGYVSRGKSRHRPRDAAHLYGGAYPFIQTGDVKHAGLYLTEYSQTYSDAGLAQSKLWPTGTLCITIAANIAETAILGIEACFPDSVIGFIPDAGKADVRYIKYLFEARLKLEYKQFTQGAAQDNLSQGKLLSIKFRVPQEVKEQAKIADFISAYDELIENSRRRIKLLEESARQLYREWFVLYKFPGSEHVKKNNGIPDGWSHRALGDFFDVMHGHAFKGEYFSDDETDRILLTPGNFKIGGGIKFGKLKYYLEDAPLEESYTLESGDILLSMTDLSKESDTLGLPLIVPQNNRLKFLHNQRLGKIVKRGDGYFPRYFFYNLFQDYRYRSFVVGAATGTSVKHSSPIRIKSYMALVPDSLDCEIINQFDEFSGACQREVDVLLNQCIALEQARNLLLPRLMNGDITV